MPSDDIVETAAEAERLARPPLLVLDRVRSFLDEHGLGSGPVRARRIGEGGGSNFTFLLERGEDTFVLRRPPRPPLPPSAHDMVREARLQLALRAAGFTRLPTIVAVGEDENVLGVPFYVMEELNGLVITETLPPAVVHGDFRLGNTMVARDDPSRIVAVLDWEMGAIGDPRADVGYLLATYSEPRGPANPLGTSPVTAMEGFPSKAELAAR